MSIVGDIKDVAILMQKAGNIELHEKILNIQATALDMQEEIRQLKEENTELKKVKDLEENIERHQDYYITLKDDCAKIKYCAVCWGLSQKLIQIYAQDARPQCPVCNSEKRIVRHRMKMVSPVSISRTIGRGV